MPPAIEHLEKVRRLNFLLRFGFFATGIATVLIGQVLPVLAARLEINDREAGDFFIFQFAGSLGGTLASNWFGRRHRYLPAAVVGCFLIAAGVLFLNLDSFAGCCAGFFLNGLGIGLTLPAMNMLTLELNPAGGSALNILNFFWGVGAISSQPFVDFFRSGTGVFLPTGILAVVLSIVGLAFLLTPREIEKNLRPDGEKKARGGAAAADNDDEPPPTPIWSEPLAWLIALFNFIHVGFESGMGGWLKTFTGRVEGGGAPDAAGVFPPILLYFLFVVAGRAAAPLFLRVLDENQLLMVNLLVTLAGTGVLLFAGDVWLLSLGAGVAGFGTSSIFPTNVSRFAKTFGATATRRATPLFLCGTLGAAVTTWAIGFASNYFGDLRWGMFLLLGGVTTLVFLQIYLMFRSKRAGG